MSDLLTEIADLALSIQKDAAALYTASQGFTPTAKKAEALVIAAGMRAKQLRWRRLMRSMVQVEIERAEAAAARKAELDAETKRRLARYARDMGAAA